MGKIPRGTDCSIHRHESHECRAKSVVVCARSQRTISKRPFKWSTTKSSWCVTFRFIRFVSTTSFLSLARLTSLTFPKKMGGLPGFRSWQDRSMALRVVRKFWNVLPVILLMRLMKSSLHVGQLSCWKPNIFACRCGGSASQGHVP